MAGNMGDMGDMGDMANRALALGAGALVWPDRVDLPFAVVPDPNGGARASDTRFGHQGTFTRWTTEWKATALLAEFTDTAAWQNRATAASNGGTAKAAGGLTLTPWTERKEFAAGINDGVNEEINLLLIAAETERADALGEIVGQHMSFVPHLLALLDATPGSHPATNLLINSAVLITGFVGQHFKQISQRRRPGQVCPSLNPPIDVPGHAAYPSGHAAQAHLCALSLADAFGEPPTMTGAASPLPKLAPALGVLPEAGALPAVRAFAWRVGRNREIAGVHYRSDTLGGREMAESLYVALRSMKGYQDLIRTVHAEWN
jgi:hypothetical protein